MNESEKRRKQLLEETRSLYSDWRTPPAVHPRYRAAYGKLYKREEDQEEMPGTFGLRALLCFLLFAAFVAMDQQGGKILEADSTQITEEITTDLDVAEVWQNL
ncbi:hypothetical protein FND36_08045 [Lachnospiraceae bacterium KGMB03038]|nr:hypothetical protein FND36_08045 [Lachnospiraceae bacterium KGMB03038]